MCFKIPDHKFLRKVENYLFFCSGNFNVYFSVGKFKMFVDDRATFWRWIGAA